MMSMTQRLKASLVKVVQTGSGEVYGFGKATFAPDDEWKHMKRLTIENCRGFYIFNNEEKAIEAINDPEWIKYLVNCDDN